MSNAAKHRKKAAEFEQLKQIDRAIAAYIKAVEESEREGEDVDVALLNKVGDLALRQGRVADAVTYYERAVEHYATAGLLNNAIALCNKILRSAPGRSNVYFTLGRICARKGLRGDATRNFLEYATRMQQEGRVDEGMRALAEVADLMPELTEVRRLVEEHAQRAGVVLPRRKTPLSTPAAPDPQTPRFDNKSRELVFLDLGAGEGFTRRNTPPLAPRVPTPAKPMLASSGRHRTPVRPESGANKVVSLQTQSLDAFMLFDPNRPTPTEPLRPITPLESLAIASAAGEEKVATPAVIESPEATSPLASSALEAMPSLVIDAPLPPVSEAPVESVVEPLVELVASPIAETPVELVAEVFVEPSVEVVADAIAEPVVAQQAHDVDGPQLDVAVASETQIDAANAPQDVPQDVSPIDSPIGSTVEQHGEPHVAQHIEPQVAQHVEPQVAQHVEPQVAQHIEPQVTQHIEPQVAQHTEPDVAQHVELQVEPHVAPADGLESVADLEGMSVEAVEGLTSDEFDPSLATEQASPEVVLDWLMPPDDAYDITPTPADSGAVEANSNDVQADALAGLIVEDFAHVADDPQAVVVTGTTAGAPIHDDVLESLTPLDVSPIPELDAAIEAGAMTATMGDVEPPLAIRQPPFRLDPHDFILPGELPPLMVEDDQVFAGMKFAMDAVNEALAPASAWSDREESLTTPNAVDASTGDAPIIDAHARDGESDADDDAGSDDILDVATPFDKAEQPNDEPPADVFGATSVDISADASDAGDDLETEALLRDAIEADRAVRSTPSLHIAAVAAEANAVATSRREELRAAVLRAPQDWVLRRRLAESLFEVGEREAGLAELQAAVSGFAQAGDLASAADIADELVRIAPERIAFHQKRVELAVRLADQQRLRVAYLDLADILVRMGDDVRAHAVYARVLEIDPWDERARTALGSAAPPPPQAEAPAENYVSLADWLQEDEPGTTRMRMREPQVSGDEQADFDSLLRHFKEGVARSLGEEDFESHYDLGVAYKEMGLLDDAISEFQKALRSRRHRLPAYEALGQCFVEQNRHSVAATVLARAVHEPGPTDEHRIGVLYLLAYSCEALQRLDEARSYYSRVYATDIHFRDVAARMAALDLIAR